MTASLLRLPLRARLVPRTLCRWRTYATPPLAAIQPRPSTKHSSTAEEDDGASSVSGATKKLHGKTKVQDFLDYVASSSGVTLADAERCRPVNHAAPGSLEYEQDYQNALDTLMRSFNLKQLRDILSLYGSTPRPGRTKRSYAVHIIEHHWDWPSLTELQKQRRDTTEIVSATYPLTPYQSFLLLGQDGADMLSLSSKYHARLSLQADPLSLKVEGLRGPIRRLDLYLEELKSGISSETFDLPTSNPLKPEKLQHVSRMSGAFVETAVPGKVRIYSRAGDRLAPLTARRLIVQASLQAPTTGTASLALPAEPHQGVPSDYSLFPFQPSRATPWVPKNTKFYRLRRIAGEVGSEGSLREAVMLDTNIMGLDGATIDPLNLYPELIQHPSVNDLQFSRSLSTTFGYSLLAFRQGQGALLPLRQPLSSSGLLPWLRSRSVDRTFVPAAPLLFWGTLPKQPTTYLHLIYQPTNPSFGEAAISYEVPISLDHDNSQQIEALSADCKLQQERKLDVLVPECPTDLQIIATASAALPPTSWPQELLQHHSEILNRLNSPRETQYLPEPPLLLSWNELPFALSSYVTVRRFEDQEDEQSIRLLENITDLTTRRKSSVGKIIHPSIDGLTSIQTLVKNCSQYIQPTQPTTVPTDDLLDIA
ncbi:hypothetical protein BDN72DRAFT_830172 [Pluteus cervinus]|uniref:Uncharacterized protein n=1 Tax=Pluteus cervinus TaxID=181527 RepID=A0ACD3BGX4_9AGAR|nr:hypothetical protein BDN72DRAFT_830172 [Pluteus cervinus]